MTALDDLGREVLRVLLDPESWKPGTTREIVKTLAKGKK